MLMFQFIFCLVIYGVVLLLVVVSFMAGSTAAVLMSPGYGGYQIATLPPYYSIKPYAATGYSTTKAPEYHAAAYDAYGLHHQRAC